jgi:uncharacterized SAM-dependent methyltransferase
MPQQPHERFVPYRMDVEIQQEAFARDVAHSLTARRKMLLAKYLYDTQGCQWEERICTLPEYYPDRKKKGYFCLAPCATRPRRRPYDCP